MPRLITAWNETKSIAAWARDSRATADDKAIQKRLRRGWPPEKAIGYRAPLITALGESKTKRAWSRDPRCKVSYNALGLRLLDMGPDDAILAPKFETMKYEAFGLKLSLSDLSRDPRCVVTMTTLYGRVRRGWAVEDAMVTPTWARDGRVKKVRAYGEEKSVVGWSMDGRCRVNLKTLQKRLKTGWAPERAISEPVGPGKFVK